MFITVIFRTGEEYEICAEEKSAQGKHDGENEAETGSDHAAPTQKGARGHGCHGAETQRADVEPAQNKTTRNPPGDR